MRHIRKLICILLSTLMLMSVLSGCDEEETSEEKSFVVRASVCAPVASFDPAMNTDLRAETLFYAMYENLLRPGFDEDGNVSPEPGVAKEYQEIQNFDGTVDYVFTLRSAARWSDGSRVKAKDFVYAWKRLVDPAMGSPNASILSMVQGYDEAVNTGDLSRLAVSAEGDATFHVTLSAPCAYFLSDVCTAVATMPLRSEQESKNSSWATSSTVLCNGAYQVGVWAKEDYIQLRRNTSYHDTRSVTPDMLRLIFSDDAEEAMSFYENGTVDLASAVPDRAGATAYPPMRTVSCVYYNHISDVFSNAHVRRAFDLVLDRASLAAEAGAGARAATGFVPYGIVGASRDEDFRTAGGELCAADVEGYEARCLDAENELRLGGYWGGSGFPEVTCICVGSAQHTAIRVAGMWSAKLGVTVNAEPLDQEEFDRRLAMGEYDLAVGTIFARYADASSYLDLFSGQDGNNALHYVNKPYDLLIGVAKTSHDSAARSAMLHDAEALLLEDTALSPLYFGNSAYLLRETLTGVRCDLNGNLFLTGVAEAADEAGES